METTIPFQGFYHSIHDAALDDALNTCLSDDSGEVISESLHTLAFDSISWTAAHSDYAKKYTRELARLFDFDSLKFKLLSSPKYYNFETDRIICDISLVEAQAIYKLVNKCDLMKKLKERFTSHDGFISFYSNKLIDWPSDIAEWDLNQVGTLLEVYIEGHEDYTQDFEYSILSNLDDKPYQIISDLMPPRAWKIVNYLYERAQR